MTAPINVCIGTYGDVNHWGRLAMERAWPSVDRQTIPPAAVSVGHDTDLAAARNGCARAADAEWLCFLDADDELDERYLEAMTTVIADLDGPALIQPSTLGIHSDGHEDPHPVLIPPKPLIDGNYLIIGTLIRTDQFHRLGGFRDLPLYEDWDLWLRAWLDGATVVHCPDAIYRVHVNATGRNTPSRDLQVSVYNRIRSQHLPSARARRPA